MRWRCRQATPSYLQRGPAIEEVVTLIIVWISGCPVPETRGTKFEKDPLGITDLPTPLKQITYHYPTKDIQNT